MAAQGKRPGIQPADQLPEDARRVIEPLTDIASRMTGVSLPKIRKLTAAATNDDIVAKLNEVIARIQED